MHSLIFAQPVLLEKPKSDYSNPSNLENFTQRVKTGLSRISQLVSFFIYSCDNSIRESSLRITFFPSCQAQVNFSLLYKSLKTNCSEEVPCCLK